MPKHTIGTASIHQSRGCEPSAVHDVNRNQALVGCMVARTAGCSFLTRVPELRFPADL